VSLVLVLGRKLFSRAEGIAREQAWALVAEVATPCSRQSLRHALSIRSIAVAAPTVIGFEADKTLGVQEAAKTMGVNRQWLQRATTRSALRATPGGENHQDFGTGTQTLAAQKYAVSTPHLVVADRDDHECSLHLPG